ncbi:MAG: hypothetical protein ACMXYA_00965, partial [Candidatus Woesearchaeota archaeon]
SKFTLMYQKYVVIIFILTSLIPLVLSNDLEITVTENIDCTDAYEIFRVFTEYNSHAATTTSARLRDPTFELAFCYDNSDQMVIHPPPDSQFEDMVRTCTGRNHIFSLYSQFNSHVDMQSVTNNIFTNPRFADEEWNANIPVCFGLFENCRVQGSSANTNYEVTIAQVSHPTNAHIYGPDFSHDTIPTQYVVCEVPYCGSSDIGTVYPILFDFETNYEDTDFTPKTEGQFVQFQYDSELAFTNARSGRFFFPMINPEEKIIFDEIYKQDWSWYDHLEFYILPETIGGLFLEINDVRISIDEYVVGMYKKLEWNLVRIPLSIFPDIETVESIAFIHNAFFANFDEDIGGNYLVDTFMLRDTSANPTSLTDRFFCSGHTTGTGLVLPRWRSDLNEVSGSSFACQQSPFTSTGTNCCGEGFFETYADGELGCYIDSVISSNSVFSYIDFTLNSNQFEQRLCVGKPCRINIPLVLSDTSASDKFVLTDFDDSVDIRFESTNGTTSNKTDDILLMYDTRPNFIYGEELVLGELNQTQETGNYGFYFCGLDSSVKEAFQGASDTLQDANTCMVVNDYFCSTEGFWSNDNDNVEGAYFDDAIDANLRHSPRPASDRLVEKFDFADNPEQPSGCCPHDSCWHEGVCFANQANAEYSGVIRDGDYFHEGLSGQRCINGEWEYQERQRGLRQTDFGFCSNPNSCFIASSIFDPIQPGNCIDDGEFYQDYLCKEGSWSTRTVLVSGLLKEFAGVTASDSFTLHCDYFENVLNFGGQTLTTDGRQYRDILTGQQITQEGLSGRVTSLCDLSLSENEVEDCVNNFCILQKNNVFYLGTSLNQINDEGGEFVRPDEIFNQLYDDLNLNCAGSPNSAGFIRCSSNSGDTWQFNEDLHIVLYTQDQRNLLQRSLDLFSTTWNGFLNIFRASSLERLVPEDSLIQILYEKQNSQIHVAAFREEEGKARAAAHNYVVTFGERTENVETISFICDSLIEYNALRLRQTGIQPLELQGCASSEPQDIFITSNIADSREIWSRITISLRDTE